MTAHRLLEALIDGGRPVHSGLWADFWNELHSGAVNGAEATSVLSSLSTSIPVGDTVAGMLRSLRERADPIPEDFTGAVNIVGTGGGPATFNISTAAALVAAATGVRVVKTGSRARTSRYGSIDLLARLGIEPTSSYPETRDKLHRFGIAFTGSFVYPTEVAALHRLAGGRNDKSLRRFTNLLGPLLAQLPVTAQVIGVSEHRVLPALRQAARELDRVVWLCDNHLGADELLAFSANSIYDNQRDSTLSTMDLGILREPGTLADLAPHPAGTPVAEHFMDVLAGRAGPQATATVCLNAAATVVAAGAADWPEALARARFAVTGGSAAKLAERLRTNDRTPREVSVGG